MIRIQAALADLGAVALQAESKYNFLNSDVEYKIHYQASLGRPTLGGSVYESLDFESLFAENRSINRRRGGGLEMGTPLRGRLAVKILVGGEQHLFVPLKEDAAMRSWTLNWTEFQIGIPVQAPEGSRERGGAFLLSFRRGFPQLSGSFDFLRISATARGVLSLGPWVDLAGLFTSSGFASARSVAGGPEVPFFEHEKSGGYGRLRGYRIDEFTARESIFSRLEARVAYPAKLPGPKWGWALDRLEAVFSLDLAAGEKHLWSGGAAGFRDAAIHRGIAGGLCFHLLYKGKRRIEVSTLAARALDPGRGTVFYFIHTVR